MAKISEDSADDEKLSAQGELLLRNKSAFGSDGEEFLFGRRPRKSFIGAIDAAGGGRNVLKKNGYLTDGGLGSIWAEELDQTPRADKTEISAREPNFLLSSESSRLVLLYRMGRWNARRVKITAVLQAKERPIRIPLCLGN